MITKKDHELIYKIVDEFGEDRKVDLRNKIINLLSKKEKSIKRKYITLIEGI